jgi:hypothetical protein
MYNTLNKFYKVYVENAFLFAKLRQFKLLIAVSKENDIFQIAKKPIRDGRLALPDLKNEFCLGTFHIKKVPSDPGKIGRSGMRFLGSSSTDYLFSWNFSA